MSTPANAKDFDAYLATIHRASRFTGLLSLAGLLLVLGALVLATQRLGNSRSELRQVSQEVSAKHDELQRMQTELRSATDSLVRIREGFATYRAVVREQVPAVDVAAAEVARDSATTARVVYIQFRGTISRDLVNELRARINGAGYNAPGVERIDRSFATAVKYFHPEDEALAAEIARQTREFFAGRRCPLSISPKDASGSGLRAPVGQVEVWIDLNCEGAAEAA